MCGISGYYGDKAPLKAVMITLGQLERGTQGSGVAYVYNGEIRILKAPINPVNFITNNLGRLRVNARVAIAHNRLPSKGRVKYENTHPFLACNGYFAVAHNGHSFIENYRAMLTRKHKIQGETDSEIIMHLLEELYDELGDMVLAMKGLETYGFMGAIVVLTKKYEIFAMRNHHYPLVVGYNKYGMALASTKTALALTLGNPDKIFEPRAYEVVRITHKGVERYP